MDYSRVFVQPMLARYAEYASMCRNFRDSACSVLEDGTSRLL